MEYLTDDDKDNFSQRDQEDEDEYEDEEWDE